MDRVENSNERRDDAPGEADELPVHGEEQADVEIPTPCDETQSEAPREDLDVEALTARAAEADALADKLKRVEAEFMNETKRIRRKAEQDRKYDIEKVVVDLLPVVDALNSASETLGDDEASAPMRAGLALVEKQMQGIFERYGIAAIEALGTPFDPARHQAMMMVENAEFEPQTVCQVMRAGYELNGRVVRPAEVIVVKAPAPEPAASEGQVDEPADEED
jgi:molecular chaperone GrpE